MHYVCVSATNEDVARDLVSTKAGFDPETVGQVVIVTDDGDSSRQRNFVFETSNDVTKHPHYASADLSDNFELDDVLEDGPMLLYGREVTAGG